MAYIKLRERTLVHGLNVHAIATHENIIGVAIVGATLKLITSSDKAGVSENEVRTFIVTDRHHDVYVEDGHWLKPIGVVSHADDISVVFEEVKRS